MHQKKSISLYIFGVEIYRISQAYFIWFFLPSIPIQCRWLSYLWLRITTSNDHREPYYCSIIRSSNFTALLHSIEHRSYKIRDKTLCISSYLVGGPRANNHSSSSNFLWGGVISSSAFTEVERKKTEGQRFRRTADGRTSERTDSPTDGRRSGRDNFTAIP